MSEFMVGLYDGSVRNLDGSRIKCNGVDWHESGWQLHLHFGLDAFQRIPFPLGDSDFYHQPTISHEQLSIPVYIDKLVRNGKEYRHWQELPNFDSFTAYVYPESKGCNEVLAWLFEPKKATSTPKRRVYYARRSGAKP
jgi:hypothetical protein